MQLKSIAVAAMLMISVQAYADTSALVKQNPEAYADDTYWTPERFKHAQEIPMPKADPSRIKEMTVPPRNQASAVSGHGAPPKVNINSLQVKLYEPDPALPPQTPSSDQNLSKNHGSSNDEFSSSRLVPLSADQVYPYRAVGRLFFSSEDGKSYSCTATVIQPRIILTAGHCVHDGKGSIGKFYTHFVFIPAYRDGNAPFAKWDWSIAVVTTDWANGGGIVPNAADYAMIELKDHKVFTETYRVGDMTGYLGYLTQSLIPNHAHQLGYPCNLDQCQKMHQVTAQSATAVAPNDAEYGSDMKGGSSGGPWIQNFGVYADGQYGGNNSAPNQIIGVTSYAYIDANLRVQGGSIFDNRFTNLLLKICKYHDRNCAIG